MIKLIVLAMFTAALVLGVGVGPAQAGDERRCVSQQEYRDVRMGWRQARVADHFDIPGVRIGYYHDNGGYIDTMWKYRKCSPWGPGGWYVGIGYDNYSNRAWPRDAYMRVWAKVPSNPYQLLADY